MDLGRAEVAFGLVRGGRHLQVSGEAEYVGFPVAQYFQQQPGLALPGKAAAAGGRRQSDQHTVAEQFVQRVGEVGGDGVQALFAGQVGVVDQGA